MEILKSASIMKLKLIFIISLLLNNSCKKDSDCGHQSSDEYQPIEELKVVPYNDFSELTFINKTTLDTNLFVGQGYVYDWGKYTSQEYCPQTYNLQRRYIVFICTKNSDKITIQHTFLKPGSRTMIISYKNKSRSLNAGYLKQPSSDSLLIEGNYYNNVKKINPENSTTTLGYLFTLKEGLLQIVIPTSNDTLNLVNVKL